MSTSEDWSQSWGRSAEIRFILLADPQHGSVPYSEGMLQQLGIPTGFFREPAVPDPPRRVPYDWWLVGLMVVAAVTEYFANTELILRPWLTVLALALIPAMLFRRTHPLQSMAVVFITVNVTLMVVAVVWEYPEGPYSLAFLLIHVYALFRWGSGRDCAIGLVIMSAAYVVGLVFDANGFGEAIGGLLVLLFPVELGIVFRLKHFSRLQAIDEVRSAEREQIARELHDSVAHHVSAIVIQAQAGRTLAATNPAAAVRALEVIEEAAARTLSDMRSMVGTLRGDDDAELAPQPGLREIASLAGVVGGVDIAVDASQCPDAPLAVGTALYRIAQESVTNAVRHAAQASRVDVCVVREGEMVQLTVRDNGRANSAEARPAGYGLVGMAERVRLLGGTLDAGPSPSGGWLVEAELPLGAGQR